MKFKRWAMAAVVSSTALTAQAQVALAEGFDDVSALATNGWLSVNRSPLPGTNWFQGNTGIFNAASGAASSYAAANFLGATSGAVSNWLITPLLNLDAASVVSFAVRSAGDGFLDQLDVLVSTTGTAAADFSLIGSYASSTDAGWVNTSFNVGLAGATPAYIAFRYVVADVATAGNYIGLDNVVIGAVPEPASVVLLGFGVAGLLARRRFVA